MPQLKPSVSSDIEAMKAAAAKKPQPAQAARKTLLGLVPSDEQQKALDAFAAGKNVCTRAVAGAGKTTLLMMLAAAHPGVRFLIVTYNKRLEKESNARIAEHGLRNITVRTYHGAASAAYGRVIHNDVKYIAALRAPPPCLGRLACDVLLLDEVQDMLIPYYLFARLIAPVEEKIGKQIVIVGDENQAINRHKGARVEFLTQCERLFHTGHPWGMSPFPTSRRLTPATAAFVNVHVLGAPLIIGGNLTDPNLAPAYVVVNYHNGARIRATEIKARIQKYGAENVAVLVPSTRSMKKNAANPMAACVREYLGGVPIYIAGDDEAVDEAVTRGKLLIATFNSMKGCERDCVLVDCFDENYFMFYEKDWGARPGVPNVLYVAATRPRKELVVFADAARTLRSVDVARLAATARVVGRLKPRKKEPEEKDDLKERYLSVSDLARHASAEVLAAAAGHFKVLGRRRVPAPAAAAPPLTVTFETAQLQQAGRFAGCFEAGAVYAEQVAGLYGTAIPVIVEVEKNGTASIDGLVVPTVLEDAPVRGKKKRTVRADLGEISQETLDSYPPEFWPAAAATKEVPIRERGWADWFRLAVAENALRGGAHHVARQIQHYDWIDEDFARAAVDAVSATLEPLTGEFEVELPPFGHVSRGKSNTVIGRADFVEATGGDVWEFKCANEITDAHLLQLACYLAMKDTRAPGLATTGHLYAFLSGQIVSIAVKDGPGLLRLLLDRHDGAEEHDIVEDIEAFKRSLAEGGAVDDEPAAPSEPAEDEADVPQCNVDDLF